ncbi:MAG: hypothetical protein ACXABO_18965 [Promethearchaeota archaeon]|jgi:hypothetical protein
MRVKCQVCEKDKPKRRIKERRPVVENKLPEKYSDYKEYICMNVIQELRKDKKWYDNICENRMLILKKS